MPGDCFSYLNSYKPTPPPYTPPSPEPVLYNPSCSCEYCYNYKPTPPPYTPPSPKPILYNPSCSCEYCYNYNPRNTAAFDHQNPITSPQTTTPTTSFIEELESLRGEIQENFDQLKKMFMLRHNSQTQNPITTDQIQLIQESKSNMNSDESVQIDVSKIGTNCRALEPQLAANEDSPSLHDSSTIPSPNPAATFVNQGLVRNKQVKQRLDLEGVMNIFAGVDEQKKECNRYAPTDFYHELVNRRTPLNVDGKQYYVFKKGRKIKLLLGIEGYRKKIELNDKLIADCERMNDAQSVFDKMFNREGKNARYAITVVLAKALKLFSEMNKREWGNDKGITASSLIVYEKEFAAVSIIMSSKWAITSLEWPMNKVGKIFVEFVERESHVDWKSNPVVFVNDSTLLFANAGMNKFKAIFLGTADHTSGPSKLKRSCKTQKCLRDSRKHNDLEDVGKDTYHHTFLEILGNRPFGDYFTYETIEWACSAAAGKDVDKDEQFDQVGKVFKNTQLVEIIKVLGTPTREEVGGRLGHGIDKDFSRPHLVEFLAVTNVDFVSCESDGKIPCLVQTKLMGEFVEEIACGSYHIVVLTSRSEVFTWGRGANGRLGHGDTEDRKVPTSVEALKDRHVKNISGGSNFTASSKGHTTHPLHKEALVVVGNVESVVLQVVDSFEGRRAGVVDVSAQAALPEGHSKHKSSETGSDCKPKNMEESVEAWPYEAPRKTTLGLQIIKEAQKIWRVKLLCEVQKLDSVTTGIFIKDQKLAPSLRTSWILRGVECKEWDLLGFQ